MTQAWRVLGDRGLGEQPGVDVGVGDRDALLGREVGLELRVDDPLERDGGELLLLLGRWLPAAPSAWAVRQAAGRELRPDPALGLAAGASASMA